MTSTLFRTWQEGEAVGTIAICTRDAIAAPTAISWMMIDTSFLEPGQHVGKFIVQGHILPMQRNECLQRMEGDWILFIDDDMTFQPDAIANLIATQKMHDLDIVGGLCFQRGEPYQPTLYVAGPEGKGYTFMEKWPENTAVEVDATGMAFTLITRRALEKLVGEWPTYEERKHMPPPPIFKWGEDGLGEDFAFCREMKAAGVRIYVDTSVKIGHLSQMVIDERSFLLQVATRPADAQEAREQQLASLGYEALKVEEAREKLGW